MEPIKDIIARGDKILEELNEVIKETERLIALIKIDLEQPSKNEEYD